MIKLKVMSPLPDILKMTRDSKTLLAELPADRVATLDQCIHELAGLYPGFAARLEKEGADAVLSGLLFSIDGSVLDGPGRMNTPLSDGCEVLIFMPYAGG